MRPVLSALALLFVAALPGTASAQAGQTRAPPGLRGALWALIYRGACGALLARFFAFPENVYRNGCESPPLIGNRQEFMENGYPGGAQVLACAKTKRWGKAEAMIYKTIKGKDAAYQV